MKSKKLTLLIAGIILFIVGLMWILMTAGFWLNWLILVVGVVLFVLSFIGKKEAPTTPVAPEMPAETVPETSTEETVSEEAPKEEN